MYHTREASNIRIASNDSISVRKFYASWVKLFFHFLLTTIWTSSSISTTAIPSHQIGPIQSRRKENELSFFILSRIIFSCDSSGIRGTRSDRFQWLSKRVEKKKKAYLFPFSKGESWITKRYISIFLKPFPHANTEHFATLPPLYETLHDEYRCLATLTIRAFPEDVHVATFGRYEIANSLMGC